ncbi:uncharacterized protein LOC124370615 [Homalodisca vitripennis]|uniref:uncharacterized protein LOC124370615 n=1 Tax=Homalodisca vitripennis TaxID=197043 RepID=UPI001EEB4448|nr:uncharacterized protein LOC124370615 [Homalodisca vitripennis]
MGDRTVANIVNEVSVAIWTTMQPDYLPQPTSETWLSIASDFNSRWNFPHCVGAIDGKHIVIKKPNKSGSSYYNYKHTFSIVLMAAVDATSKFTFIDVGSMGRFSDGDEAFPLMCNLMRPYPKKQVTDNHENKVFNYRLSRARQTDECAFGILASRFRVFQKPFEIKVSSVWRKTAQVNNVEQFLCLDHKCGQSTCGTTLPCLTLRHNMRAL